MAGGRDGSAYFRGVVRVVIDHIDALRRAQSLEPTLHATKGSEPRRHGRYRAPEGKSRAECRQRVADVVQTRYRELHLTEIVAVEDHVEARAHRIEHQIAGHESRIGRMRGWCRARGGRAVRDDLVARGEAQGHGSLVIGAPHDHARGRDVLLEGAQDIVEIPIDVEMIGLDIEHHRDGRIEREKRAIVFVGFDHIGLAAEPKIPGPPLDAAAHHTGRFTSRRRERFGGHHGRRGLAVGAGDTDQRATADGISQRLGAPDQRDAGSACGVHFRMRRGDRRRIHHGPRTGHERGIVRGHGDAIARQIRCAGGIRVGALNADAAAGEQFSERTHAGTGDPDEVHGTRIGAIEQNGGRRRRSAGAGLGNGAGKRRRHGFNMARGSADPHRIEVQGPDDRLRDLSGGAGAGSREGGLLHDGERGAIVPQAAHGGIERGHRKVALRHIARGAGCVRRLRVVRLVILRRAGQRHQQRRDSPGTQLGNAHCAGAGDREIGRRVGVGNRCQVRAHPHHVRFTVEIGRRLLLPRGPDHRDAIGKPLLGPGGDHFVEGTRPLTAAHHEHDEGLLGEPPEAARLGPRARRGRRRLDRTPQRQHLCTGADREPIGGFRKSEEERFRAVGERARGQPGVRVGFVQHGGDAVCTPPGQCDARRVSAGADDGARCVRRGELGDRPPRTDRAHDRTPVPPRRLPVQRMEIEQRVPELGGRQHIAFDAATCPDEVRLDVRRLLHQGPRDGQSGVQVAARATAREEDARGRGRHAVEPSGSVAPAPYTRSRSLPMFTRMPVMAIVSTRLERP